MLETASLLLFVSASLVRLLIPGPAVLFIVARSIEQRRAAGVRRAGRAASGFTYLGLGLYTALSSVEHRR